MATTEQFIIDHKLHAEVVSVFRRRAARLNLFAVAIIVIIILVLAAGISIFVLAGQIANRESNQALLKEKRDNLLALDAEIKDASDERNRRLEEREETRSNFEREVLGLGITHARGRGLAAEFYEKNMRDAEENLKWHENRLQTLYKRRESMREDLIKAEAAASESIGISQNQIPVLVSAFATRVGAVVLLLFLVQILVPLYRYNMKLSSYYDARADALTIIGTNRPEEVTGSNGANNATDPAPARTSVDTLERLVAALSPDNIDFGKAPATPSESALRFAKDVITSQRK